MKYARKHIKKYHDFAYRRAIGTSMVTFSIALAVGIIFTLLFNGVIGYDYTLFFGFWMLLTIITVFILVVSFAGAHAYSIKHMSRKEKNAHSKYLTLWIVALVAGILVFTLPTMLLLPKGIISYDLVPLLFLFSFGGILWVIYLASAMLFESFYHEIVFGAIMLWAVFGIGVFNFSNLVSSYFLINGVLVLAVSAISLILVFGFVGLMMIASSSRILVEKVEGRGEEED